MLLIQIMKKGMYKCTTTCYMKQQNGEQQQVDKEHTSTLAWTETKDPLHSDTHQQTLFKNEWSQCRHIISISPSVGLLM